MYLNASILEERKTNQQTQLINLFKKKAIFFENWLCVYWLFFHSQKRSITKSLARESLNEAIYLKIWTLKINTKTKSILNIFNERTKITETA